MVTIIDSDDDSDEAPEQLQYKVVVLGDGAVGKTSLALRFTGDHCTTSYKQTIGVDFFLKQMVLPSDIHVAIQLWDIGGQTIGSKMIGNYIFGAQAVILAYDITNYQSFQNLEDWLSVVKQTFGPWPGPYLALVANKTDLSHLRQVSTAKHERFAEENNLVSFSVSARTGSGVAPCFLRIAADLAGVVLSRRDLQASEAPSGGIAALPFRGDRPWQPSGGGGETNVNPLASWLHDVEDDAEGSHGGATGAHRVPPGAAGEAATQLPGGRKGGRGAPGSQSGSRRSGEGEGPKASPARMSRFFGVRSERGGGRDSKRQCAVM